MNEDWRLTGHEEYLQNAVLYKVVFPDFWQRAYIDKNAFYQLVLKEAVSHVDRFPHTKEYLEADKIQLFWHAHCDLCWEKAMTDIECEFYCTKDMLHWVCKECFDDFKDKFGWTVKSSDELFV